MSVASHSDNIEYWALYATSDMVQDTDIVTVVSNRKSCALSNGDVADDLD